MTIFEKWWTSAGLAEHVRLCGMFCVPVTDDTMAAGKFIAWRAWNASTDKSLEIIYSEPEAA